MTFFIKKQDRYFAGFHATAKESYVGFTQPNTIDGAYAFKEREFARLINNLLHIEGRIVQENR